MAAGKLNIVLADDDPDDRELFASALSEVDQGMTLVTLEDGEKLFTRLRTMPLPDIIFLDLNMPRKNGRECLAEIHKDRSFDSIAVIIYSTSISPHEMEDAWNSGAACLIRKPDSYTTLKEIIQKVLRIDFSDLDKLKKQRTTFNL